MSYYRGMGVILRMPTRTPGFRGMRGLRGARRMGRLGWLGQDATDYSTLPVDTTGTYNFPSLSPPGTPAPVVDTSGTYNLPPLQPPTSAVPTGPDILNQMQVQATIDLNPADYVSPQAAKAAGLDPATVDRVWAQGLAKYPTQQAAIAAQIAPTVVTQYWQASRAYAAAAASPTPTWLKPSNLLLGGGILFGLSLLMGGGGRRRR